MAHISSIGAVIFTDLSCAIGTVTAGKAAAALPVTYDKAGFDALFATATSNPKYLRLKNVREFPAFGAQPNLVKVPAYGQKATSTIGGQSDNPDFSVTVNYVGSDWAKGTTATTFATGDQAVMGSEFANMVGDGVARAWRLTLLPQTPATVANGGTVTPAVAQGVFDSNVGGMGTVQNTMYYFIGKVESILVTPSLTDSIQATIAFSIQGDIYGAFTV